MRSSKSRSRSKSNRPRSLGNIVNRVFDSSGPEGKVRGTPQQIIDKYLALARDAQLANDRVNAENFLQHAEHYTRMLAEAQREMTREAEARRDSGQQGGQGDGQQGRGGRQRGRDDNGREPASETEQPGDGGSAESPRGAKPQQGGVEKGDRDTTTGADSAQEPRDRESGAAAEVIDLEPGGSEESGLVETPETRSRRGRKRAPAPEAGAEKPATDTSEGADETEEAKPRPAPRRRSPRKPKSDATESDSQDSGKDQPAARRSIAE